MRSNLSRSHGVQRDQVGFPVSKSRSGVGSPATGNSADDVLGEIGLVLVVVLGIMVAINMVLIALHIGP